jgi:hypothetical protein
MKKIMAVLIAGTLIIGTAVAQTSTVPAEKKSTNSASVNKVEKKDGNTEQKKEGKHKHHHGKNNSNKPATKTGDVKAPEKK